MNEKTIDDNINVIFKIFSNDRYRRMLNIADNNWLEISVDKVITSKLNYLGDLKKYWNLQLNKKRKCSIIKCNFEIALFLLIKFLFVKIITVW